MAAPFLKAASAQAQEARSGSDGEGQAAAPGGSHRLKPPPGPRTEAYVHLNQVGFLPEEPKRAVIPATGPLRSYSFAIIDDDAIPQVRFQGHLTEFKGTEGKRDDVAERHFHADFDPLVRPGRYRLRLADGRLSPPFSIGRDIYPRLIPLILRFFEVQCCGDTHPALHDPCHLDDGLIVGGPRSGQRMDATGGWHDAGDYLKFVETASFVTALMLFAYDLFPQAFTDKEPGRDMPALLAHARVGLEWLLRMHPAPEEFYYQVGGVDDHETWRLPEQDCAAVKTDWKPRPVLFGVGANLAGRTAAAFAMAARLYRRYDRRFASRCLQAAGSVYRLGLANRSVLTTTPEDFYPEKTWADDMAWGAAELFITTKKQECLQDALEFSRAAGAAREPFSVYDTHAPAYFRLYPHAPAEERERLRDYMREDAERVRAIAERHPYGLASPYTWGTAEEAAGAAITCLLYGKAVRETDYTLVARQQRDFVLGCNSFDLSCLIGAGTHYPLFPHHQIADIKSVELSGALVGGPANILTLKQQGIGLDDARHGMKVFGPAAADLPDDAGVYQDSADDYVTNEPAIDYTAKMLLLAAFYHHAYAGGGG
jgi:endoglucanase